ncbi:MAG: Rieske 2Fe-2S domain-containing protein [Sporichthyaceae bacterium]
MVTPPDPDRRTLVRGVAAVGLAAATGTLSSCGSDSANSAGAAPAPSPTLPSKSEVFRRTPEPRPARTKASGRQDERAKAEPTAEVDPGPGKSTPKDPSAPAEVEAGTRGSGDLATARKGEDDGADAGRDSGEVKGGRATRSPKPEPTLPPDGLAFTSDIPVGGGKIFESEKVVVTQPTKGNFKGFSASCTHTGCTVGSVAQGSIICPCHGSRFSIADGTVQTGPAPAPLPPEAITVADGSIRRG